MKPDASHIRQIKVVSNTHWDREFRRSFEKTRRRLLDMMDTTLDILENDPDYHSFTMDGHTIMIEDYLEMRPERRSQIEKLVQDGRLIIGPYYTLAEEFSIGHEALVRNLIFGRRVVESLGGKTGTVAYTPSSWGQTGQLPQIFADFGLDKMMFYRGISHHEADAEWLWEAPDGTSMLASRFVLYARYNWYYQVHRPVTTGRVFEKDYQWGEFDEAPFRPADGLAGEDLTFDLQDPAKLYHPEKLEKAIKAMITAEGPHFTTEVFLAMHGHDISVAHPNESQVIRDARELLGKTYDIEHCNLEDFWNEAQKYLDLEKLPTLTGERRSYLKEGKWTFLFPGTISSRTYLKQKDFAATSNLVYHAEPLAALAASCGAEVPQAYLNRGWQYLLSNHTHDANGGCAPDAVCQDMEYRYRKAMDIGDIITEDAMAHIASQLSPAGQETDAMQIVVFNPLPIVRDAIVQVDLEIPRQHQAAAARLVSEQEGHVTRQPISNEKSSSFVDSIWEVPRILESNRVKFYAEFTKLPALGYRAYTIVPEQAEVWQNETMVTGPSSMENEQLAVTVNSNGTVDITCKTTGKRYTQLNYLRDQGETGNAWKHMAPTFDETFYSLSTTATIKVIESGPLVSTIEASYNFAIPQDYADGNSRSANLVELPVEVRYRLEKNAKKLQVTTTIDNVAKDHLLRACFPTSLNTDKSVADSHFDVVERDIALPDSTGWVERAFGTHPLRTFVGLSDGKNGLALLPKGIFEYEAIDDQERTLALTLIRACRIKLAVSEEKQTELPDVGIQCPGRQSFSYDICVHAGTWEDAALLSEAATGYTAVRAAQIGRGKGDLPLEASLLTLDNTVLHISAIKPAEDGHGIIVRLFNPSAGLQKVTLGFGQVIIGANRCGMDESDQGGVGLNGDSINDEIPAKKIVSYRVMLAGKGRK